jgi:hypothetical protein
MDDLSLVSKLPHWLGNKSKQRNRMKKFHPFDLDILGDTLLIKEPP